LAEPLAPAAAPPLPELPRRVGAAPSEAEQPNAAAASDTPQINESTE
jgi:hypothetical protein